MIGDLSLTSIVIAGLIVGGVLAVAILLWRRIFLQAGQATTTPPIGRKPTKQEQEELESAFPKINGFTITAGRTWDYNCFGYSFCNRTSRWVDPPGRTAKVQMAGLDAMYLAQGWARAKDCKPRKGFRKVAIYCDAAGFPTHAAKQLIGDWWESKLGHWERVVHKGTGTLEGVAYGKVCRCYEKSLAALIKDAQRLAKRLKGLVKMNKFFRTAYQELQDDIKRWQDALKTEAGMSGMK